MSSRIKELWKAAHRSRVAYVYCLPAIVFFVVFKIYPILQSFALSFREYQFGPGPYVGIENYARALEDKIFWQALGNTTIIVILVTVLGTVFGYALALLLSEEFMGCKLYRTLIFLPVVTSVTVISLVWKILYHPAPFGFFNSILGNFGIPPQGWLSDPNQALYSLTAPLVWQIIGYNMVIFIAAIRGVDHDLLEAAEAEGANVFQKIRHVIIPSTRYAITMVVVLAVLRTYRIFVPVYVMTFGDPMHRTETIVTWMYKQSFRFGDMGYGSALAVILFLIIMLLTLIQLRIARESEF